MRRPSTLRGACLVLAFLVMLHGCTIVYHVWSMPKAAAVVLSREDQLPRLSREVIVMHHKRLRELKNTLTNLAHVAQSGKVHLTVVQTLHESELAAAEATAALLKNISVAFSLNVSHKRFIRRSNAADGTFSVNSLLYGTKRNSFFNLVNGLDAVFIPKPELQSAIVLEDDVVLSVDTLNFFDMAASVIASSAHLPFPRKPVLATSFCFLRSDHEDYGWWHHPFIRRLISRPHHFRHEPLQFVTIKTFAWLITRGVYERMRHDALTGPAPMLALPADAPVHYSLAGCSYCENFCYDHYLEWRWRNASYLCPAVPRARAKFSGGMTERAGVLDFDNDEGHHARMRAGIELNSQLTRSWQFVEDGEVRGVARSAYRFGIWFVPAILSLCFLWICNSLFWRRGALQKTKDDHRPLRAAFTSHVVVQALQSFRQGSNFHRSYFSAFVVVSFCTAALLWLSIYRLSVLFGNREQICLHLPSQPIPLWHENSSLNGKNDAKEARFLLLWSTDARSFSLRARRCIESIFFHHPQAVVLVYSNQLPLNFFSAFQKLRYNVSVQRYELAKLLANTPAESWLSRLPEWQRGPYYYSHVTDVLRFALLFHVGGIYLDFDVIVTKPMHVRSSLNSPFQQNGHAHGMQNALGIESHEATNGQPGPILNGAVMIFEKHSRFLWNCLQEFATNYIADRWSWNGPELLTRVRGRCAHANGVRIQVEPRESFYPIHWQGLHIHADGKHITKDAQMWSTILKQSYTVHVWNRKSSVLTFANGSLLHKLHNVWTVLPEKPNCA